VFYCSAFLSGTEVDEFKFVFGIYTFLVALVLVSSTAFLISYSRCFSFHIGISIQITNASNFI
jgi:hypothetical protein